MHGGKATGARVNHPPQSDIAVKEKSRAVSLLALCAFIAGCRVNFNLYFIHEFLCAKTLCYQIQSFFFWIPVPTFLILSLVINFLAIVTVASSPLFINTYSTVSLFYRHSRSPLSLSLSLSLRVSFMTFRHYKLGAVFYSFLWSSQETDIKYFGNFLRRRQYWTKSLPSQSHVYCILNITGLYYPAA